MKDSMRLKKIVSLVNKNSNVLDIGTDHCYIPIKLLKDNIVNNIDASDISENPLKIAKNNLEKNNLEKKVNLFLSDGLKNINIEKYDLFIIAGMGGKKISSILEEKNINQTLVLNPTNNIKLVRKKLNKLKYTIVYEEIIVENNIKNIILKAKKNKYHKKMNKKDILFGPILRYSKSSVSHKYFSDLMLHYKNIYDKSKKKKHLIMWKKYENLIKWREKKL